MQANLSNQHPHIIASLHSRDEPGEGLAAVLNFFEYSEVSLRGISLRGITPQGGYFLYGHISLFHMYEACLMIRVQASKRYKRNASLAEYVSR